MTPRFPSLFSDGLPVELGILLRVKKDCVADKISAADVTDWKLDANLEEDVSIEVICGKRVA